MELSNGRRDAALEERFRRLYGQGGQQDRVRDYRRRRRRMMLTGCCVLLLAAVLRIALPQNPGISLETDESGNILSIRRPASSEGPVTLTLTAHAGQGENALEQPVTLTVVPEGSASLSVIPAAGQEFSPIEASRLAVQKTIFSLGRNAAGGTLVLPDKLEDGTALRWRPASGNPLGVFALLAVLLPPLLLSIPERRLRRDEQAAARSILRELPGFTNKIVLLMDAGMVLDASLHRIAGCGGPEGDFRSSYFYSQIFGISRDCVNTNSAMHQGIRDFALRSGLAEFVRLSNLISDSTKKGVDLMGLLALERDNLWFARKKMAEQQGRVAETKLTLPLVILLLVLVMVTITPAMLEI
jgi:hypothetical protein